MYCTNRWAACPERCFFISSLFHAHHRLWPCSTSIACPDRSAKPIRDQPQLLRLPRASAPSNIRGNRCRKVTERIGRNPSRNPVSAGVTLFAEGSSDGANRRDELERRQKRFDWVMTWREDTATSVRRRHSLSDGERWTSNDGVSPLLCGLRRDMTGGSKHRSGMNSALASNFRNSHNLTGSLKRGSQDQSDG
jgi:hypothetical protein